VSPGALARAAGAVGLHRPRTLAALVPPFLQWFALVRRRAPNTVTAYGFDLQRFLSFCAEAELAKPEDVTFQHVEFYLGWLQTVHEVAPCTANRHLYALRSWWRWMVREGIATLNPAAETFMLPTERRLPLYLTVPEQEKVLRTLAKGTTLRERRDYALIAMGLLTGLRCSELANLQLSHLDLDAGILRVVQGKGRKDREVPIISRLVAILRPYLAEVRPALLDRGTVGYVFGRAPAGRAPAAARASRWTRQARPGQALLGRTIFLRVREVVSPIIGRPVAPHTLRHSFATRLREHGADLQLIQEALGHAQITTTTMYAHLTTSKRRQDLARLLDGPGEGNA